MLINLPEGLGPSALLVLLAARHPRFNTFPRYGMAVERELWKWSYSSAARGSGKTEGGILRTVDILTHDFAESTRGNVVLRGGGELSVTCRVAPVAVCEELTKWKTRGWSLGCRTFLRSGESWSERTRSSLHRRGTSSLPCF